MKYSDKKIKGMVRKEYAGIADSLDSGCVKECCGGDSSHLVGIADIGNGTEQMVFSAYIRAASPERREAANENR